MAANSGELILLGWGASPFSARVKIALAEKGVTEYEFRHEDVHNKSTLLREMNPATNQIPVLIHNGKPISDSLVIVQYIDQVWAHNSPSSLLPSDPYHRAHARFWADYTSKIHTTGMGLWQSNEEKVKEASRKEMGEILNNLEQQLGEKPYFGGEKFGLVDLALIPFHSFFYTFDKVGGMGILAAAGFPKLMEWAERCFTEKESVSKTLWGAHQTYQVISNYRKKKGLE